ncbi:MAG: 50S ribosomal protein L32 [bacterium]|nr:50S ribosomal protein L32 [bacterium]
MVVRMRANRSKTGMRRSHAAISGTRLAKCSCGANRIAHRACLECGKYNGRIVIDIVARTKREQRRLKKRTTELRESGRDTGETKEKEKAQT